MVSKCANPTCSAPFLYLRDGRLFRVEVEAAGPQPLGERRPARRLEHFWLCGACSGLFTLTVDNGAVTTVPLSPPPARRAAAS